MDEEKIKDCIKEIVGSRSDLKCDASSFIGNTCQIHRMM